MGGSGMQAGGAPCTRGTAPMATGSAQTWRRGRRCPHARSTHLPAGLRLPGSGARSCSDGPQNLQGLGEPGDPRPQRRRGGSCQRAAAGPRVHVRPEGLPGQPARGQAVGAPSLPVGLCALGSPLLRRLPSSDSRHWGGRRAQAPLGRARLWSPRTCSGRGQAQLRGTAGPRAAFVRRDPRCPPWRVLSSAAAAGPPGAPVEGPQPGHPVALALHRSACSSALRENNCLCFAENLELSRSRVPPRAPNSDQDSRDRLRGSDPSSPKLY